MTVDEIYFVSMFKGADLGETIANVFDALSDMSDEGYKEIGESALGKLIEMSEEEYAKIPFESAK